MRNAIVELDEQHPANVALATKLMWFNESQARPYDFLPVRLAIFDAQGNLSAGLMAATGWAWLMEAGRSCPKCIPVQHKT